jgi:hypothetical protein
MKPKKEWADTKYPGANMEKFKNVLSSNKESEKVKDEKKRLKVFTNLVNASSKNKKVDDRAKGKEFSKDRQIDEPSKVRDGSVHKSVSRDRKNLRLFSPKETKSPILDNSKKIAQQNLVSQSFDNFNLEQKFINDQRKQEYYQHPPMLNQSFNAGDAGMHQYFTPGHHNRMQNNPMQPQGFNMTQDQFRNTTNGFYPDVKQRTGFTSLQQSHKMGTRCFVPSNRQYKTNVPLQNAKSPCTARVPSLGNTAQWGLKVNKISSSVKKFRRNNLMRNKSKEIKISGVTPEITPSIHQELLKIGDITELKMKWLNRGDMQVKFRDEKSAREAMERLDGMEINGTKLQVTQVFQLLGSFKLKFGRNFNQTRLQQIKESEDSDDADPESSNDNDSYPQIVEEDENDNIEQIEK